MNSLNSKNLSPLMYHTNLFLLSQGRPVPLFKRITFHYSYLPGTDNQTVSCLQSMIFMDGRFCLNPVINFPIFQCPN